MDGIHVALSAETIGTFAGIPITNTLIMSWVVLVLLISIAIAVGRRPTLVPSRIQIFLEVVITSIHDFMRETLENDAVARKYLPMLITVFLFIATANLIEFTPGIGSIGFYKPEIVDSTHQTIPTNVETSEIVPAVVNGEVAPEAVVTSEAAPVQHEGNVEFVPLLRSVNTDLNVTLALAIIAVIVIEFAGIAALGFFKYAGKFISFSSPLNFVVGLIELVSEISRLISFSFRLFGNIFAGEVLLAVVSYFVPYVLPSGLMAFELFVGVVQGAVFALLILFFIKLAITDAHAEAH